MYMTITEEKSSEEFASYQERDMLLKTFGSVTAHHAIDYLALKKPRRLETSMWLLPKITQI